MHRYPCRHALRGHSSNPIDQGPTTLYVHSAYALNAPCAATSGSKATALTSVDASKADLYEVMGLGVTRTTVQLNSLLALPDSCTKSRISTQLTPLFPPLYRPEVDLPAHPSRVQNLVMSMSVNLLSPHRQRRSSHSILTLSTRFGTCHHCVARWQLEDRSDPRNSVLLHRLKEQFALGQLPRGTLIGA